MAERTDRTVRTQWRAVSASCSGLPLPGSAGEGPAVGCRAGSDVAVEVVAATVRTVKRDGSGHLPPIPSHHGRGESGPGTSFTTLRDARDGYLKMAYLPPIR